MVRSGAPDSSPRQMPVNVTTAPISVRPRVSWAASCAVSNGSRWSRTAAFIVSVPGSALAQGAMLSPRHRGEERYFSRSHDRSIGLDVGAFDRCADDVRVVEGVRIFFAALAQPADQIR